MSDSTADAIAHWERLADEQEARLEWDRHTIESVARNKAKIYRNAARALRLGAEHGVPYCACHLIPMSECARNARESVRSQRK